MRQVVLLVVVGMVYFAQILYDQLSLVELLPVWLRAHLTLLGTLARWPAEELVTLAGWLSVIGLLGFGLITPWWLGEPVRVYRRLPGRSWRMRRVWWSVWGAGVLAGLSGLGVIWAFSREGDAAWLPMLWAGGLAAYLLGGWLANFARPAVTYGDSYLEQIHPWRSWLWMAILLALLAALYLHRLFDLPLRVSPGAAELGLMAERWLRGEELGFFARGETVPLLPAAPVALMLAAARDGLAAIRLAGVAAGLAGLAGTWALACELFRREPQYGLFGEVVEDDGRWLALLSMLALGVGTPWLQHIRLPFYLDSVALATFGLWALLRGLRRDRPLLVGLSGVGLGLVLYYGPLGWLPWLWGLLTWFGVLIFERSWLTGKELARSDGGRTVRVQRGMGWRGFAYWAAGSALTAAPLVAWVNAPTWWAPERLAYFRWPPAVASAGAGPVERLSSAAGLSPALLEQLRTAILGLNYLPDITGDAIVADHFVSSLLAPLLVLGVGALLLNIDSLTGWLLIAWSGLGVLAIGLSVPALPIWRAYLPLSPILALVVAFVLDRLRVLIMTSMGTWSMQATVYLALGILVAAGFLGWGEFYNAAHVDVDLASAVGRVVRQSDEETFILLEGNTSLGEVASTPVVQFLAGDSATELGSRPVEAAADLAQPARVLFAPQDWLKVNQLRDWYPEGELYVLRDGHANPILYIYDVP